jgi:hypothetical protein
MMSTRSPQTSNYGASGNSSRANQQTISTDPGGPIYKAATISFAGHTISDSANGFAPFAGLIGQALEVRGSASNNAIYTMTAYAAGALTVAQSLTTEAAGAGVTLLQAEG